MARNHGEPVSAMLALQRELENRFASDWMGGGTSAIGSYPPVNMFLQGDDFVAVIELPGIGKHDLAIEANKLTLRIFGKKRATSRSAGDRPSAPTRSAPNTATACSRSTYRGRQSAGRARSQSTETRRENGHERTGTSGADLPKAVTAKPGRIPVN